MGKKLTNEEFLKRLKEKAPTLEPLEKYIRSDVSIKFKCNICNTEFYNSPIHILGTRRQGCPTCYHNRQKNSTENFEDRAKKYNKNIKVVGKYTGTKNKIKVQCVYCGKYFLMRGDSILEGRGHGSCIQKNLERKPLKSQEKFVEQLKKTNNNIIPLGKYTKGKDKMIFKCLICKKTWEARTNHVMHGDSGCPHCKTSKGERRVEQYLKENNIEYNKQYKFKDCKDIRCLPFDFYLPNHNTCIEYDGEQYVKPAFGEDSFYKTLLHDAMKNNYCKWNNINLIRIPYTDFDKIETILNKFII